MVDIKAILNKARGSGRAASPRGRVILEAHSFDTGANTVTGKIIDGRGLGEVITVKLSGKLTAEDYTKKNKTKVELAEGDKPGGTLQIENLQKADGSNVYKAQWIKTFQSKPGNGHQIHTGKTFALRTFDQRNGSEAKTIANIDVLDMENEVHVTDVTALRGAMIEAIDKAGAVSIMTVTEDGSPVIQTYYAKSTKQEDGTYLRESGESRVKVLDDQLQANTRMTLEELMAPVMAGAGVSVVPVTSLRIGAGTWEAVEEKVAENGWGGPVDPASFRSPSLGLRMRIAVNSLEVAADREAISKAFLDEANEDAKAKFHQAGFHAVEERDVRSFIEKRGIKLADVSTNEPGYVKGSILTLPYNADAPGQGAMVTKTFNVSGATPLPPVEAFKDLRQAYYGEMIEAAKQIAEIELGGAKKQADQTPAAAENASVGEGQAPVEAVQSEEAANMAKMAEEEVDLLLSEIEDSIDGVNP